ncbi:MAG: hypothetical protein IPJ81_03650 [Chitinophagaceae bacterium]|nr:hypothetical protein [Chitinophagaceae bacterium]
MGYEYYIYPEKKMDTAFKKNLIQAIKKHSLLFNESAVAGKTCYEFSDAQQDLKSMPEFIIIVEDDNKIYLFSSKQRLWYRTLR